MAGWIVRYLESNYSLCKFTDKETNKTAIRPEITVPMHKPIGANGEFNLDASFWGLGTPAALVQYAYI